MLRAAELQALGPISRAPLGPCQVPCLLALGQFQVKWPVGCSYLNVVLGTISGAYHGTCVGTVLGHVRGLAGPPPHMGPERRHVEVAVTSRVACGSTQLTGVWRPWLS